MTRLGTSVFSCILLGLALSGCGGPPTDGPTVQGDPAQSTPSHDADDAHAGNDHADRAHDPRADETHDDALSTRIEADIARESGIVAAPAGPGTIADAHEVQGLLTPIEGRRARIAARFAGPVRALHANLGDAVRAGQTIAVVDSNQSLSPYALTSPISGVVVARDAAVGDIADAGRVLMEVADLSQLWVDLHVYGRDARHLRPGSPVTVVRLDDGTRQQTEVDRVLPATATASQSTVVRARLDNSDGQWRPGTAITAEVVVDRIDVALAVPLAAVQRMAGADAVFVVEGDRYVSRPVRLGRRDAVHVEVLEGLVAGEQVVVEQSYLVKADIGKADAGHAH